MRFVWAVVAFVLATLLIGAGIAQRTIFLGPSSYQTELSVVEPAGYVLIDGAVLRQHPGGQSLIVRGDGDLFAAYGRTADLEAWLADATYNSITMDDEGQPFAALIEPEVPDEEPTGEGEVPADGATDDASADVEGAEEAEATAGRNPAGSDLWLDSFSGTDRLITDMQLPEGMSILIAKDGTEPAPDDIVVSWPLDTSTPFVGPLIAAGSAVLLFGLVMYFLAFKQQRRGRGPLRKGLGPLPPTEPIDLAVVSPEERKAIETAPSNDETPADGSDPDGAKAPDSPTTGAGKSERVAHRRVRLLVLPALAMSAILVTGCTSDSWPRFDGVTPTPSPTQTVIQPENQKPPAVTDSQASRILLSISDTLQTADESMDIELASTRLSGAALAARQTDYTLRATLTDRALPAAIPTDSIEVLLPQATDTWPRTVLVLSKSNDDDTIPPVILTMAQEDPWSNYKVSELAEMQASAVIPELAPSWLGTSLITETAQAFLALPPDALAAAFADVVDAGDKSESYGLFDEVALAYATSVQESRQAVVQALIDRQAAETSDVAFAMSPSDEAPVAMATLGSGAIVAVSLVDRESITPTSSDAVIRFGDNPEAKALTGAEEAAKGVNTSYGFQLFFAVPTQGSTEPIRLLAVRQDLLNVEVIK